MQIQSSYSLRHGITKPIPGKVLHAEGRPSAQIDSSKTAEARRAWRTLAEQPRAIQLLHLKICIQFLLLELFEPI